MNQNNHNFIQLHLIAIIQLAKDQDKTNIMIAPKDKRRRLILNRNRNQLIEINLKPSWLRLKR